MSARCRAFDKALAEEREATSDKWEVLEKATQCLDAIVAAFDPGKSPTKAPPCQATGGRPLMPLY